MGSDYAAPRTLTEQVLADLWAELLGMKNVGIHDDFFAELGGHSLLATQIVSRLRELLGIELSVRGLFDTPTIAGLADTIDRSKASSLPASELTDRDEQPPSTVTTTIPRLNRERF